MKKLLTIIIFTIPVAVFAQGGNEQDKLSACEANLPGELRQLYDQEKIRSLYNIRTDLNPFYLRGDFDGDKKQDYALSIVEKKTKKKGILVYHAGTKTHYIMGAGKSLKNGIKGDDYRWMDAWKVYDEKDVENGVGETEKISLKGE